jgi:hypothetical protein
VKSISGNECSFGSLAFDNIGHVFNAFILGDILKHRVEKDIAVQASFSKVNAFFQTGIDFLLCHAKQKIEFMFLRKRFRNGSVSPARK